VTIPGPPALAAADAGGGLGERERFRQAVVGAMARPSPQSSTLEGALSMINRGRSSLATRGAAHLVVEPGLVAVEPHNVVGGERGQLEGLNAVEGKVDRDPLPPQADSDRLGELGAVFDEEHAHRCQ
jgi:hypothetical protein